MKYPVSVWMDYYDDLSVPEAIARFTKHGFFYGELSLTHLEQLMQMGDPTATGKQLRRWEEAYDYAIPQGHLSFEGGLCDDSALERLMPEIDMFAAAGIGKAVLHTNGGQELSEQERYDRWVHYVRKLSEYTEGTGVTLCLENMALNPLCRTANQIKSIINDAGGKNLAICLDTGHLHLAREKKLTQQTHREFILESNDLLQALHITDNNGIGDTHQMPFSARYGVDWKPVLIALSEVGYKGLFNLESLGERIAPLPIRDAKLAFIRSMCDYMLSDAYLADPYVNPPYDMR